MCEKVLRAIVNFIILNISLELIMPNILAVQHFDRIFNDIFQTQMNSSELYTLVIINNNL